MWENRADGKRKLKLHAVPTIFGSEAKKIVSSKNENTTKAFAIYGKILYIYLKILN